MMKSECVICGSRDYSLQEEWRRFRLAECNHCGVTFTLNPDYHPAAYDAAYKGTEGTPVPEEHSYVYVAPAKRLELETQAFLAPPSRLTPAEKMALFWLKRNAGKENIVIDCGCGSGRFLRALKCSGFRAVGVEISEELVEKLRKADFEAIVGKAPDFPWDSRPPYAITFFEVLEHIPDPVPMLSMLKERFPTSVVLASVPSPYRAGLLLKGERGLSDYPPNHFLRWTPEALKIAFSRAGYSKVDVILPKPIGSEMLPGLGQLIFKLQRRGKGFTVEVTGSKKSKPMLGRRMRATVVLWALYAYQRMADLLGYPIAFQARRKGASASSMLVIARSGGK